MWGYHHDMSAWAWWLMTAGMALFWGVVIWLVVTLSRSGTTATRSAEEILAERFAQGELTEDEFRQRRELVRH
jgi:putative membrane protein